MADHQSKYTGAQMEAAFAASHSHENNAVLDKLGETDGQLTIDGKPVIRALTDEETQTLIAKL
jgi:hypothetical protein